jgi:hypothetical protein
MKRLVNQASKKLEFNATISCSGAEINVGLKG